MNEEEKQAIEILQGLCTDDCINKDVIQTIVKLIDKQQKEINFYKVQELGYIQGYEDGKSHKQTAVAMKNEYEQEMLIQRKMEEYEKEIKFLKSQIPQKTMYYYKDYISKDKIKEKIEEITSYAYTSAEERDCQDYAIQVLKELLGE